MWPITDLNSATVTAVKDSNHMKKNRRIFVRRSIGVCAVTIAASLFLQPVLTRAQTASPATKEASQNGAALRDGRHDFDFAFGNWKFHLKKLEHPLAGSNTWIELEGHSSCREVWDGANFDEVEVYSADRKTHIKGLTLRLYNPESHQWSLYWGNAAKGVLSLPAVVGEFKNGRGEFYDQEDYNGRMILVRYHTDLGALRTIVFHRWRKDVGNELDHRSDSRETVAVAGVADPGRALLQICATSRVQ
jgi:hypothetical protein